MADNTLRDPLLERVLASAAETRAQCLSIFDFLEQHRVTDPSDVPEESHLELSKHQKVLIGNLAQLRGLHRKAILDARSTKQQTAEAKSEIDTLHLHLQNLFYEQRHLSGEIAACDNYDHKYQSLPLVPMNEFLSSHPESSEAGDHDLMIARIEDEHQRRQALEEQRQELLKKKQALLAENKKKREELDALDKEIEKFVNSSSAVQKIFENRDQKEVRSSPPQTTVTVA